MRRKLLEKRQALYQSAFWRLHKKKIQEIDAQLWSIDRFMHITAKLRLHRDQPYWGQVELDELLMLYSKKSLRS